MKRILEKYPVFKYIAGAYVKYLAYALLIFTVLFALFEFTGIYVRLESVLDLKYNSPFVLVPLYVFAVLAVLCFVTGVLLYFYKYKRSKTKSVFYKYISDLLSEKQAD